LIECEADSLIREKEDNYIIRDIIFNGVPNVFPECDVSLSHYEDLIK